MVSCLGVHHSANKLFAPDVFRQALDGLSADIRIVQALCCPVKISLVIHRRSPRLRAGRNHAPDAWIGTEGIERLALAAGGTQFELLSRTTKHDLQSLRAVDFERQLAVYAPVVLTDNEDAILDALGAYVTRRQSVVNALSDGVTGGSKSHTTIPDGISTDSTAVGHTRDVLLNASHEFALAGSAGRVNARINELREAGVDTVVGYLARGSEKIFN